MPSQELEGKLRVSNVVKQLRGINAGPIQNEISTPLKTKGKLTSAPVERRRRMGGRLRVFSHELGDIVDLAPDSQPAVVSLPVFGHLERDRILNRFFFFFFFFLI